MATNPKGVANFKRRKWDNDEYISKRLKRQDASRPNARETEDDVEYVTSGVSVFKKMGGAKRMLEKREAVLNIDAQIGESQVEDVSKAGFECTLCDRAFKDSSSYLAHVNSEQHLLNQGFSLNVKKSSATDVVAKLAALAEKKSTEVVGGGIRDLDSESSEEDSEVEREKRKQKRKRKKKNAREQKKNRPRNEPVHDDRESLPRDLGFNRF